MEILHLNSWLNISKSLNKFILLHVNRLMKKILNNNWFIGITCSIIASLLISIGEDLIAVPYATSFLQSKIVLEIWELMLLLVGLIFIYLIIKISFDWDKKFLSYKSDSWSSINWIWDWKKNSLTKKYEITNLNMLCPKCDSGIFTVGTMYSQNYDCVQCGFSVSIRQFPKPTHAQIEDEIYNKIRLQFPSETKYIDHKN